MKRTNLLLLFAIVACMTGAETRIPCNEVQDIRQWRRFSVSHPVSSIKQSDLENARQNMASHKWARQYAAKMRRAGDKHVNEFTDDFLERMVEITTAGSQTPCPACRDKALS